MHRLPNPNTVRRFRFTALLLILKWLLVAGAFSILGVALIFARRELAFLSIGLGSSGVILWLTHWLLSLRTRCPLCLVPSFSLQRCTRSSKAKRLFGSYPLFVAVTVVCKGNFRCPYCGEATAIKSRQRLPHLPTRREPARNPDHASRVASSLRDA